MGQDTVIGVTDVTPSRYGSGLFPGRKNSDPYGSAEVRGLEHKRDRRARSAKVAKGVVRDLVATKPAHVMP